MAKVWTWVKTVGVKGVLCGKMKGAPQRAADVDDPSGGREDDEADAAHGDVVV